MITDRVKIFTILKKELKKFAKKPIRIRDDTPGRFYLWAEKKGINILGKERNELFFAGLIIQSSYVGFYYMPIYVNPSIGKDFSKELLKTLKGKSCFHIKKLDTTRIADIKDALSKGYTFYKKEGWV